MKDVEFAATVVSVAKFVQVDPLQRSMRKPVSSLELSVHESAIELREALVLVRLEGAAGAAASLAMRSRLKLMSELATSA